MRKYLPIIVLYCFWSMPTGAQITPKSGSVPADWAAYIELVLPADPTLAQEQTFATVGVLKLAIEDNQWNEVRPRHSLNHKLWELVKAGGWPIFEDAEMLRPTNFEAALLYMSRTDTVLTFDPETYEETITINALRQLPPEAPFIKVRQLLTYDNASANFDLITTAIAPCFDNGFTPYWMAVPDASWDQTPNEEDISWAIRFQTEDNTPGPERWQEIKNTTGPLLDRFIDRLRGDETILLADPATGKTIMGKERECLFACTQTIEVFDPQTNTELSQEVYSGLDQEQVTELQLLQEWFWSDTENRLYTRLMAVAPRFWVLDPERQRDTYPKILFYRRVR
jgi:hypothetical protein